MQNKVFSVDTMSREVFFQKIVRGFAKSHTFSKLVCLGVDSLTEKEGASIRAEMVEAGIRPEEIKTDMDLAVMAQRITARSVTIS